MSLKSFDTLLTAWLLVPVVVAIVSWGLGSGLRLLGGMELGALTLPAGYLAGMALMSFAVEAGLSGKAATAALRGSGGRGARCRPRPQARHRAARRLAALGCRRRVSWRTPSAWRRWWGAGTWACSATC